VSATLYATVAAQKSGKLAYLIALNDKPLIIQQNDSKFTF